MLLLLRLRGLMLFFSGNALVVAGTTGCTIALTWGGITAPWSSAQVLVPLILGVFLLGLFLVWEAVFAKYPLVRFHPPSFLPPVNSPDPCTSGPIRSYGKPHQSQRVRNNITNGVPFFSLHAFKIPANVLRGSCCTGCSLHVVHSLPHFRFTHLFWSCPIAKRV